MSSLFLFGERLYTTCFGWEIENNDAKGWAGVGKIFLSLSLVDVVMEELEMWSYTIR